MSAKPEQHADKCPLAAVHKRLEDLHRAWHAAQNAYFDPEGFRVAIQTAIQTSRTVTFILQSNKHVITDYENWYAKWQAEFKADPLMRWMVDARNKIEKQGDLEAHSFVRAEIVASHMNEGPMIEVPAELFDAPLKLVKSIPDNALGTHLKRQGTLRIQRRWKENTLPEYELLDAVALSYGSLSRMLDDAHRQLGLAVPESRNIETGELYDSEAMGGRMPCMIGHGDLRSIDVWLADGTPVEFEEIERTITREDLARLDGRYDIKPEEMYGKGETPEGTLEALFTTAGIMLEKDGYHSTIMFFFKGKQLLQLMELRPEEHGQKYIMMRNLAHELIRKGADTVIMIGEVWRATYDAAAPFRRVADAPDRREMLVATLVRKSGEPIQLATLMTRDGEKIRLGPTDRVDGGAQFLFAPFYEAWGREIPSEWAKAEMAARAGDASGTE